MSAGATIRRGVASDLAEVSRIERACFPSPWSDAALGLELSGDPRRLALVVEEEGRLIGFALVWVVADELHLVSLAVDPARRREGWAQALLDRLLDTEEGRRANLLTLEVRPTNSAAVALYHRNGFLDIALRPNYYPETGEDALVMLKPLRPEGDVGDPA